MTGNVVWPSHLLESFPQFVVIHTKILAVKRLSTMWETRIQSLGQEDLLEKVMATHSSVLAWKIPWTKERGRLQSIGSQRVGHE